MYSTIIFLSFLIIFLSLLIVINVDGSFDTETYIFRINIKIFKIKIITIDINLITLQYSVGNRKPQKLLQIISKEEKYVLSQIKYSILDKLYYDRLLIKCTIGSGEPSTTAIITGVLNKILWLFASTLKSHNNELDISMIAKGEFGVDKSEIQIGLRVIISIFDLIFGIIVSFYRRGKYAKQARKFNG